MSTQDVHRNIYTAKKTNSNTKLRVMIDLDGTISYDPIFFNIFTQCVAQYADIHIVTNRKSDELEETKELLRNKGITYHYLTLTYYKAVYAKENNINIVFEDEDEFFQLMPEDVTVFKIRETHNYDWKSNRWVYSEKTGINVEDL